MRRAALVGLWFAFPLLAQAPPEPSVKVLRALAVQPNTPAFGDPLEGTERALAEAEAAVDALEGEAPGLAVQLDLVALPEGSVPVDVMRSPTVVGRLQRLSDRVRAPVVFGGWARSPSEELGTTSNAAFVVGPEGLREGIYRKRRLVPAVEWIPMGGENVGLVAGQDPGLLSLGDDTWGVLICYEIIFPALTRDLAAGGAQALLNLSNDAWYGSPGPGRLGLEQHSLHAALRAVESGLPLLRVANTGRSFVALPSGRILDPTPIRESTARVFEVPIRPSAPTLFSRTGDLVGAGCAVLTVLLLLVGPARLSRPRP